MIGSWGRFDFRAVCSDLAQALDPVSRIGSPAFAHRSHPRLRHGSSSFCRLNGGRQARDLASRSGPLSLKGGIPCCQGGLEFGSQSLVSLSRYVELVGHSGKAAGCET